MKFRVLYIGDKVAQGELSKQKEELDIVVIKSIDYIERPLDGIDVIILKAEGNLSNQIHQIQHLKLLTINSMIELIIIGDPMYFDKYQEYGLKELFSTNSSFNQILTRALFLCKYSVNDDNIYDKTYLNYTTRLPKRIFDILFAGSLIIVLSPLMLLIAILIRLESKGKVIYSSKRVGSGYKIFDFYKFRSMYPDADKRIAELLSQNQYKTKDFAEVNSLKELKYAALLLGDSGFINENSHVQEKKLKQKRAFFKVSNDPRITKVGRLLRNTSMDELPQLFNVLKGDMSIVGNRPLPLYEAEKLTTDQWAKRFLAPAGLTGLWQVTERAKLDQMSADGRKELDVQYAENNSFWGDMWILVKTIPAVFQHESV
nr:sugar transferase [uncultured Carboxylicivirga sp.]